MSTLHPFEGPRGLRGYTQLRDTDGSKVDVQESSAVHIGRSDLPEAYEGRFVWLRVYETAKGLPRAPGEGYAHLTVEMATEVRDALTAFIEEAT